MPSLPLTVTASNEFTVTINSTEPHPYLINFTGYVGTTSAGTCPEGTTLVQTELPSGTPSPSETGAPTPQNGRACSFSLYAQKKYVEATKLTIVPESECGGSINPTAGGILGGTPCLFKVTATGMVVLKSGVNCSDGTEPANGSPAPADFPGDATTGAIPVYECTNGVLSVTGVGVPNLPLTLTSANGQLSPFCIPQSRVPTAVPTPNPTDTGNGFPTAIPTATATPLPTDTTPAGTAAPAPTSIPTPTSFRQLAFCLQSGASTLVTATNSSGVAGNTPIDISAEVSGFPNRTVSATGTFASNGAPIPGVGMYVTLSYPLQVPPSYCPPDGSPTYTNANGSATCTTSTDGQPFGEFVPTDVSFVANCLEYGIHTGFFVGQPASAVDLAHFPDPFCVLRTGDGPLTINATFTSDLNTQPSLSTGNVQLGAFGLPTPTPIPTAAPTDTPVAVPTDTPGTTPGAGATPGVVATGTATATATATSTLIAGPLNFSVTAARVSNVNNPGNRKGLDAVRQGQKVWLMLYYTVRRLPSNVSRSTTYTVQLGNRKMFKVAYKASQSVSETGTFVRYTVFTVPRNAAFGTYMYKGTLKLGGKSETKSWKFSVVRYSSVAGSRRALLLRVRAMLRQGL